MDLKKKSWYRSEYSTEVSDWEWYGFSVSSGV